MVSILRIKKLGFSSTDPVLEVKVRCDNCNKSKRYMPTLSQLKNLCDDWEVHRTDGVIQWAAGNTRLLTCPNCAQTTSFKICIHRDGTIIIYDEGTEALEGWDSLD